MKYMTTEDGRRKTETRHPSPVTRHQSLVLRPSSHVGWLVFALGALWDIAYHAPTILFAVQWPAAIDSIGEFGHVVTFVGAVVIIFAILRKHERK